MEFFKCFLGYMLVIGIIVAIAVAFMGAIWLAVYIDEETESPWIWHVTLWTSASVALAFGLALINCS
mgnify:FL=1